MTLGWKQVENLMCIACAKLIKEHGKKDMGRCLFRIQSSYIFDSRKYERRSLDFKVQPTDLTPKPLEAKSPNFFKPKNSKFGIVKTPPEEE